MKKTSFTPEELAELAAFDAEEDAQRRRNMAIRWYGFKIAHLPRIADARSASIDELVRGKEGSA